MCKHPSKLFTLVLVVDFQFNFFSLDSFFILQRLLVKLMVLFIPPLSIYCLTTLKLLVKADQIDLGHLSHILAVVDPDLIREVYLHFEEPQAKHNS